jgi:diamine N-acetyltransferase
MTLDRCKSFIHGAGEQENCCHLAIADEQDEYLGTISLKEIQNGEAEYAISTRSIAHGTGAAMAATRQILEIAFEELGLMRVYLNVLADNGRANAFYRKAGFRYTHTEENALEIRGQMKDLNWYEIGKDEYDQ